MNKANIPCRGRSVEKPTPIASSNQSILSALRLALEEKVSGDEGPTFGSIDEAGIVIPQCFEPPDPAEGGELDEKVGIEVEKLPDQVIVAIGRRPVDGGGIPPLVPGALPPKREVRLWHREDKIKKNEVDKRSQDEENIEEQMFQWSNK